MTNLNTLINKYKYSDQSIFSDFALFLIKYKEPIVNSFIKVKVYRKSARTEQEYYARLSNGPMESFNRKPKILNENLEDSLILIIHAIVFSGLQETIQALEAFLNQIMR